MRSGLLVLLACAVSLPAVASFHLMKIVEVFPGTAAAPGAQYVILQMYNGGQNQVGGHGITVFDAGNSVVGTESFTGPVPIGATQSKILIATAEAVALFGLRADLLLDVPFAPAGGKVCFDSSPVDCLAWGSYAGPSTGIGTPYAQGTGLTFGRAAIRRLDIVAPATTLQAGDDTDECSTDFVDAPPAPRANNSLFFNGLE